MPARVIRLTWPTTVREAVSRALDGAPRDLVVDVRDLRVMTNIEGGVLVAARARQQARGHRLTLLLDRGCAAVDALSRTGLSGSFHTTEAVDGAPAPGGTRS